MSDEPHDSPGRTDYITQNPQLITDVLSGTCVIMAATAKNMAGVSDDSSSSDDDEVMKRCKEAVWETRSDTKKDGEIKVQQSKRFVVADHEHDGNELQVSEGFRTHVATKLGHLLEGSIAEMYTENASCVEPKICDDDDAEGFRLFSTSVPGQAADDPPAPVRRRRVPSSSDSDSEMETRLREAAVSVKDLVSQSALLATTFTPSAEPPGSEKKRKVAEEEEEESHVGVVKKKKRKKKRKPTQEGNEQVDLASPPHSAQRNGEQEDTRVKVKRKKKKKQREIHTDELN
ncbi:protein CUSTOS [Pungitius pungitius]|uniref:protein CUSTOS n=1 Tax=Pungitius pungitius TaxID=134920 RepID=UPI002E15EBA0